MPASSVGTSVVRVFRAVNKQVYGIMGDSRAIPTGRDRLNATIYAFNVKHRSRVPVFFAAKFRDIRIVSVEDDWPPDVLLLQPQQRDVLEKRFSAKFADEHSCMLLSCFPRDFHGNQCDENTPTQYWKTTTQPDIFSSCQFGCFTSNFKSNIGKDTPVPSFTELTWGDGKCLIDNLYIKLFALYPSLRDKKANPGITDAPPFQFVAYADRTGPFDGMRMTNAYCEFFGSSLRGSGADARCDTNVFQDGVELLFGKLVSRFVGNGAAMVRARNTQYRVETDPPDTLLFDTTRRVFARTIGSESVFAEQDSLTRQRVAAEFPEFADHILQRANSRRLLMRDDVDYAARFVRPSDVVEAATTSTRQRDGAVVADNEDTFVESLTSGQFFVDAAAALGADIALEVSLSQLRKAALRVVDQLSGSTGQLITSNLKTLGGRRLIATIVQTLVMKNVGKFAVASSVARAVAIGLSRAIALGSTVVGWVVLLVGLVGFLLDIFDPANLGKQFTQEYLDKMIRTFVAEYRQTYGLDPGKLAELTPEALYDLNNLKTPGVVGMTVVEPEDDSAPEVTVIEMKAMSAFLLSLNTNSYGQTLDWENDLSDPTVQTLSPKERALAVSSVDEMAVKVYNARARAAYESAATSSAPTVSFVAMCVVAVAALTAVTCLAFTARAVRVAATILFVVALVALVVWFVYKRQFIQREQNIFRTAFDLAVTATQDQDRGGEDYTVHDNVGDK